MYDFVTSIFVISVGLPVIIFLLQRLIKGCFKLTDSLAISDYDDSCSVLGMGFGMISSVVSHLRSVN